MNKLQPLFADPSVVDKNTNGEDTGGRKLELKTYEARYNHRGDRTRLEVGTNHFDLDKNRDYDSAIILVRQYDKYRELEGTVLEIRSPHIKTALQKVIRTYPGIDLHSSVVVISGPPRCIFYYGEQLREYGKSLQDMEAAQHLALLLDYCQGLFETDRVKWGNQMESPMLPPRMDFLGLWMVYRPGDIVYTKRGGIERAARLKKISRCECTNPSCWDSKWSIVVENLTFDGSKFGYACEGFGISPFDGFLSIDQFAVFPLKYHQEKDRLQKKFIARGRKFVALKGSHYRSYNGVAKALSPWRDTGIHGEEDYFPLQSMMIKGRIMLDTKTFCSVKPSNSIDIHSKLDPEKFGEVFEDEHSHRVVAKFTDEDYIICEYSVPGFDFAGKRWCHFTIDFIEDIEFNSEAFERLLLPKEQKRMIHSLVEVHSNDAVTFDDLIAGKGKGMVFLLHGLPGTGKTLTAEGVADYTKRPLYSVTCGELGLHAKEVEENLSNALRLATTWDAIVLIDEADIFLEARSHNDLRRNGLVSVFLRLLEYYQGILILTTNRVSVFDPAIKSRIHLAVNYHPLTHEFRRDIWKTFITKACNRTEPAWLNVPTLDELAEEDLNGRQIKNTVKTAQALAVSDKTELKLEHIKQSLVAMGMFEADFARGGKRRGSAGSEDESSGRAAKRRRAESPETDMEF